MTEPEVVHRRVNGWCDTCGGRGRRSIRHIEAVDVDRGALLGVLQVIAEHVRDAVTIRMAELEHGHGCEAAAARAREQGRLQVVDRDMWEALGLPVPEREVS